MPLFTLLNTRPSHQAAGLNSAVEKVGGTALACPTMQIQQLSLSGDHASLASFDKVVFISANAVKAFLELNLPKQTLPTLFAIGKATVQAGLKAGLQLNTALGEQFDSEALLQHPDLQQLENQRILIVKGESGRTLLAETLQARGAHIEQWSLYRRQPLPLCREAWQDFTQASNPIVLATSITGLEYLFRALEQPDRVGLKHQIQPNIQQNQTEQAWSDAQKHWLLSQSLVVFSQRIKQWAREHGWQGKIVVVATQSDQGIVNSIENEILGIKVSKNKEHGL